MTTTDPFASVEDQGIDDDDFYYRNINDDDDDDADEPYDDGTLLTDDIWEDRLAFNGIRAKYPDQYIMKVVRYGSSTFGELEEWCQDNCRDQWKKIGWSSGCSYTVAIVFWSHVDAIIYRMRWQSQ